MFGTGRSRPVKVGRKTIFWPRKLGNETGRNGARWSKERRNRCAEYSAMTVVAGGALGQSDRKPAEAATEDLRSWR